LSVKLGGDFSIAPEIALLTILPEDTELNNGMSTLNGSKSIYTGSRDWRHEHF
jgi:hypothetical protein